MLLGPKKVPYDTLLILREEKNTNPKEEENIQTKLFVTNPQNLEFFFLKCKKVFAAEKIQSLLQNIPQTS